MDHIQSEYRLGDCLDWILSNNYTRIILQFKHEDLKHSVNIVEQLKDAHSRSANISDKDYQPLDLYVTQSNTCCVDLIVTQHVSNVDALIHFGNVCLSKPQIHNDEGNKPILFLFNFIKEDPELLDKQVEDIVDHLNSIHQDNSNRPTYFLYDTSLIALAKRLRDRLIGSPLERYADVANLNCLSSNWHTIDADKSIFSDAAKDGAYVIGHYVLPKQAGDYKSAIYLGERLSIHLKLEGPSNLWKVTYRENVDWEQVSVSRSLNKRMALVQRLKDDDELKIGVIITNPLPNITDMMDKLKMYAKSKRHTLYFISMIQTIDECKIGNFDLCDAFVIINSCTCSTILESLVFNRPILNDLEFKLACGYEAEYGRVLWPGSETHLSAEDLVNRRKVSDVSLALVHMRNDLLERCSRARANMWSGLDYKAPVNSSDEGTPGGSGDTGVESLAIEEGLRGIASTYSSEPLRKSSEDNQSGATSSDAKDPALNTLAGVGDDKRIE